MLERAPLLVLDPELGRGLEGRRLAVARSRLVVPTRLLPEGPLDLGGVAPPTPSHLGLLVVDGVIAREVLIDDTVSTELIAAGDIVRPWGIDASAPLLEATVRWSVLAEARAAALDRRLCAELANYPEVYSAIVDRLDERAGRLATSKAISELTRVDRRLMALFWHLADRWGRVTPGGVHVPLRLSHRLLGQLVGARRPTVSAALAALSAAGELVRRQDGTWLMPDGPVGRPSAATTRFVAPRRALSATPA